eukprot:COSAG01_NODE_10638_length_2115_cov_9.554563_2_plen_68_part_00
MVHSDSNSQRKKRPALVLYRTGELAQPAQQAAHQNLLVEPSLAARAPAHITARIPLLECINTRHPGL